MVKFLIVFLSFILILLTISFVVSFIIFKKAFGRVKTRVSFTKPVFQKYLKGMEEGANYFRELNPESLKIISDDGLCLRGHLYNNAKSKATVILVHGYHGEGIYDCSMLYHFYEQRNFAIFVPDLRAHGESEGKYLTFGIKESKDMIKWAELIAQKFPNRPIVLHGVSMGGATVSMMADKKIPKEITAIIDDCGFTSPDEIISHVRKCHHLPKFPFQYFVRFFAKVFAKVSLTEMDTKKCYSSSTLPVLFIHGGKDNFVPTYMGYENYKSSASKHKKIVIAENSGHALSVLEEREKIEKAIDEFLEENLFN